jgi:GxxExxY protein
MEDEKLTYKIRGCIYDVSKELGAGFLEQVYKNALGSVDLSDIRLALRLWSLRGNKMTAAIS